MKKIGINRNTRDTIRIVRINKLKDMLLGVQSIKLKSHLPVNLGLTSEILSELDRKTKYLSSGVGDVIKEILDDNTKNPYAIVSRSLYSVISKSGNSSPDLIEDVNALHNIKESIKNGSIVGMDKIRFLDMIFSDKLKNIVDFNDENDVKNILANPIFLSEMDKELDFINSLSSASSGNFIEQNDGLISVSGKNIVLTGLMRMQRAVIEKRIQNAGGYTSNKVTSSTDILVVSDSEIAKNGGKRTVKMIDAYNKGTLAISESDFFNNYDIN